jgi:hypothetical protein
MKSMLSRSCVVGLMACPIAASAATLLGVWEGSVVGPHATHGEEATFNFMSPPPNANYNVSGTLLVVCTLGGPYPGGCGTDGVSIPITGILGSDNSLTFGSGAQALSGSLSGNSFTVSGLDSDGFAFTITASTVPEPCMIALFGLGLAGVAVTNRRKRPLLKSALVSLRIPISLPVAQSYPLEA